MRRDYREEANTMRVLIGLFLAVAIFAIYPLLVHLFWNVALIGWGGAALYHLGYWPCVGFGVIFALLTHGYYLGESK